ncbi:MAG: hypothetical protein ACRCYC_09360 [Paraclostridium sp.]|uniref:hypothetical protein n=1 Tax=Paraclostridium sp. TaxID=2023273 RepID=UPI003F35EF8A
MKKQLGICLMTVFCTILVFTLTFSLFLKPEDSVFTSKNSKYITKENNSLGVYEYIHELTHAFINVNKENVNIIAPTKEARKLGSELCESEIYSKGDMDAFTEIGYRIDKIQYGLIDDDTITLHNLAAENSGNKDCIANGLNYEIIYEIAHDNKFFDDNDRINYYNNIQDKPGFIK